MVRNMKWDRFLFVFSTVLLSSSLASASVKKLALVYRGPGSCTQECSESPAQILQKMGFEVKFVGPKDNDPHLFDGATLWLQPGGLVRDQHRAMSSNLKKNIINFVKNGGGYIGLCAGAFLASESYSWNSDRDGVFTEYGLNFFPGSSTIYDAGRTPKDEPIEVALIKSSSTANTVRQLYWEEGPVFTPNSKWSGIEIMGTYPNLQPATLRRTYGKGRVYVTAFHPEAPQSWRDYYHLEDQDGLDFSMLESMISWVNP